MFKKALLTGLVAAAGLAFSANAAPVVGAPIIVGQTGNVTAYFDGSDAGYNNELYLYSSALGLIFANHNPSYPNGASFDLGHYTAGTELVFELFVASTGDHFYSGTGGALNLDGIAHAAVDAQGNTTYVGFEDIYGGGDFDYNDLNFSLVNTPDAVPEPATWAMLISGFGMIGGAMRVRARQNAALQTA